MKKRRAAALVAALAVPLGAAAMIPAAQADDVKTVRVVGLADWHGALVAGEYAKGKGSFDAATYGQDVLDSIPGVKCLASTVKHLRDEDPNLLFLAAGDMVTDATTRANYLSGSWASVVALNEMGLDATAIGNHVMSDGVMVNKPRSDMSDFMWLGANAQADTWVDDVSDEDEKYGEGVWRTEVDGVKVAVIGVMTSDANNMYARYSKNLYGHIDNQQETANRLADEIRANGDADAVIVLAHTGHGGDVTCPAKKSAASKDDCWRNYTDDNGWSDSINFVLGGHTHYSKANQTSDTQLLLQPYNYARELASVDIAVKDGKVVSVTGSNIKPELGGECEANAYNMGQLEDAITKYYDKNSYFEGKTTGQMQNARGKAIVNEDLAGLPGLLEFFGAERPVTAPQCKVKE